MEQNKLPQGLTYKKLYQINDQNMWFLAWVLKQRRCNPDFNQEILSAPFTVYRKYRSNGQLDYLISYKNGQRHGLSRGWHPSGQLWWEQEWQYGQKHGLARGWVSNGQLSWEQEWEQEWQHGQQISKK